jgi:hypothetical protein
MVLGLVAGCAEPAATPAASTTPTVARTGNGISPTPNPEASGALVVFQRTGGIAGVDDTLIVRPDGQYTITRRDGVRKQGALTAAEQAALRAVLAGFDALPTDNPGGGVADGYAYRIQHGSRVVAANDGDLPPAVSRVIGELNQLLSRYGG